MVKHEHSRSGRITGTKPRSSNSMRNGNQPDDIEIKSEALAVDSPSDPHAPLDDLTLDNVRDAPRDASGPLAGVTTAEKLGDLGPVPGAQRDPAPPGVGPLPTHLFILLVLVVVLIVAIVLATAL